MDALLNLLLSYLSGFTGVGGAAFAVSSGLAGLLTWFNIRKANQEAAETAEKRRQETEKRTSSVLTNLKDAGRFLTGEPSSQEKEIDNQLLNLEAEKDSLQHEIDSFNSTLQLKHIEGVSPHYFQTRASISNAQSLLSIIKTHLLAIRESQEVLSYVGQARREREARRQGRARPDRGGEAGTRPQQGRGGDFQLVHGEREQDPPGTGGTS